LEEESAAVVAGDDEVVVDVVAVGAAGWLQPAFRATTELTKKQGKKCFRISDSEE